MNNNIQEDYAAKVQEILEDISCNHIHTGIHKLQMLKDDIYANIPAKKRQSQGITWVVQQIGHMLFSHCEIDESARDTAVLLYNNLPEKDLLMGVAIYLMAFYGCIHPENIFDFFEKVAGSEDWVVREFAAGGFHKVIAAQRQIVHPWLVKIAQADNPYLRRFASETLRPVTDNRWLNKEPEYSLSVLRLLFHEAHPYPRTSVGNNLSDLSRHQPEMIFSIVKDLVASKDKNSFWIAYRACRNLVKKEPDRVMNILGIDEYHYKDRNYYRHGKDQ